MPDPRRWAATARSGHIEAHKETILSELDRVPDITIEELRRVLSARGLVFGFGTLQRFFARHRITRKKDRARERAGAP